MIFLWSCFSEPVSSDWLIEGPELNGWVVAQGNQAELFLEAERVGTNGIVSAEWVRESGIDWLYFELETGGGAAQAVLRIEGKEARLPLGARSGEFDLVGQAENKKTTEDEKQLDLESMLTRIAREKTYWDNGHFVLYDGEEQVGDMVLNDDSKVSLYGSIWLTPEAQSPNISSEGGDLLLELFAEPSLQGERAQLRVNIPLREVVIPTSHVPSSLDRRFELKPEQLSAVKRRELKKFAVEQSNIQEKDWLSKAGPVLLNTLSQDCLVFEQPDLLELWVGYDVTSERIDVQDEGLKSKGMCRINFEPNPPQHRRRFKGHFDQNGIVGHIVQN
ncbi:MAG: hypothetical protein CMK59_05685 [Proteobacteria bacterium]|nr:hypothetical protein [Pseudomonadota bacterium]